MLDFLTRRLQYVRVGNTLNTSAPQGCVLSALLFTPLTHEWVAKHTSNHIIKFADDTTVMGLLWNNDESAYREEVNQFTEWSTDNNRSPNVVRQNR